MEHKLKYTSFFSTRAANNLKRSYTWYEDQQIGLGSKFVEEVLKQVSKIELNPEAFSIRYKFYREAVTAKFPFIIVFRTNKGKKSVRIISIFHTAQDPKKKY